VYDCDWDGGLGGVYGDVEGVFEGAEVVGGGRWWGRRRQRVVRVGFEVDGGGCGVSIGIWIGLGF
jgi:hypothetical protein